jgi:hypothetical protein
MSAEAKYCYEFSLMHPNLIPEVDTPNAEANKL